MRKTNPKRIRLSFQSYGVTAFSLKRDLSIAAISALVCLSIVSFVMTVFLGGYIQGALYTDQLKTRYLIENLRGDTIEVSKSWKLAPGESLNVNIANAELLSNEKLNAIKESIISEETLFFADLLVHKDLNGDHSKYYAGWVGALKDVSRIETKFFVPTEINVFESKGQEGNIVIRLSTLKDVDGYTGYTKSTVDGDEILKSIITIYDVDNLSADQLGAIVRHEFGHALGLGHSTAPEDLMAATFVNSVPYISECDFQALVTVFNDEAVDEIRCEK